MSDETVTNPLNFEAEEERPESDEGKVGRLKENPPEEELILSAPLDIPVTSTALLSQEPEPVGLFLREWGPLNNLLSKIPMKAQKGLTTLDLKLTCIAVVTDYLILGTNVGLVYWYSRKTDVLDRLKANVIINI